MPNISANKNACIPFRKNSRKINSKKQTGLFAGILLALLPKCPFCYMAFSGTLMLCGNGTAMYTRTFFSMPTLIFSIACCLLILLFIVLNFRDRRTLYAIAKVISGSAMIIYSTAVAGGLYLYYSGVILIFFGVWLNASLLYFVNEIKRHLRKNIHAASNKEAAFVH